MTHTKLTSGDVALVVSRIPKAVKELMESNARLVIAGGFIREVIAGGTARDLDLFSNDIENNKVLAKALAEKTKGEVTSTANALTVVSPRTIPVQFIQRWTLTTVDELLGTFDFTICQAAIWHGGAGTWCSRVGECFYPDLAARRLFYADPPFATSEPGATLLRILKFVKRGYTIQIPSLAKVVARMSEKCDHEKETGHTDPTYRQIFRMLREVDPTAAKAHERDDDGRGPEDPSA